MDAPTMIAFGQVALLHKAGLTWKGRAIKDLAEIPADFADDTYWA